MKDGVVSAFLLTKICFLGFLRVHPSGFVLIKKIKILVVFFNKILFFRDNYTNFSTFFFPPSKQCLRHADFV